MHNIRIGTRGGRLAFWQAAFAERLIAERNPGISLERVIIKTEGDRDQNSSLTTIGGRGCLVERVII